MFFSLSLYLFSFLLKDLSSSPFLSFHSFALPFSRLFFLPFESIKAGVFSFVTRSLSFSRLFFVPYENIKAGAFSFVTWSLSFSLLLCLPLISYGFTIFSISIELFILSLPTSRLSFHNFPLSLSIWQNLSLNSLR